MRSAQLQHLLHPRRFSLLRSLASSPVRGLCSTRSDVLDEKFVKFHLFDVLNIEEELLTKERYQHVSREIISESLRTAMKIAEEKFSTHNKKNDAMEPKFDPSTNRVVMNDEVSQALNAYRDAGFFSVHADSEVGGMQLPFTVSACLQSAFTAANCGTCAYPFLTIAAGNMLRAVGTPDQQERYLLPMLEGRVFGTMNLSETQAGSSLGDITTRAERRGDGSFSITGQKMWISAGDHELSDNIFHMVLAKIRDPSSEGSNSNANAGVKGISLFIVPKYRLPHQDKPGARNGVALAGLNHKMGYRGTTNCVMVFGGDDDTDSGGGECIGELLGEEGKGLAAMFHMMNEARVSVGLGAAALGYSAYAKSLEYARQRRQGRPLGGSPSAEQVPIIQHADVKRMLLSQKATVEGAHSLGLYGSFLVDKIRSAQDDLMKLPAESKEREEVSSRLNELKLVLDTLTPVIKVIMWVVLMCTAHSILIVQSWPSEWCLEANKWAIQVHGGYGYTRDYDVEQIYRDNRLNMIHEGTNGIQSLDLLGRKVLNHNGRGFELVIETVKASIDKARGVSSDVEGFQQLQEHADLLDGAIDRLLRTTKVVLASAKASPSLMLANSHQYLNMFGHTMVAWRWLEMETAALKTVHDGGSDHSADFIKGMQMSSRYFFRHELPITVSQSDILMSLDDTNISMKDQYF